MISSPGKKFATRENLIILLFASTFLHFVLTAVAALVTGCIILFRKDFRKHTFVHRGWPILMAFLLLSAVLAVIHSNWAGLGCSVGFFFILVIGMWVRSAMRPRVLERALDLCAVISILIAFCAVIERVFFVGADLRCALWFFNANYLATMCMVALVVCIYKILSRNRHTKIYIAGIAANMVTIYLTGSLFTWVDIFVATIVLLILFKKWRILGVFFGIVCLTALAIILFPQILPRVMTVMDTTNTRFSEWLASTEEIRKSPLFGRGFMTYMQICHEYPGAFISHHAHNIIIDPLLNFGIIGTAVLLPYFVFYFLSLKRCYENLTCRTTTHLILALSVAIIVHGLVDITLVWLQTGLILVLIMGGLGAEEKRLKRHLANSGKRWLPTL